MPEGSTAGQTLAALCVEGLRELGLENNQEYVGRLRHEVAVIEDEVSQNIFNEGHQTLPSKDSSLVPVEVLRQAHWLRMY